MIHYLLLGLLSHFKIKIRIQIGGPLKREPRTADQSPAGRLIYSWPPTRTADGKAKTTYAPAQNAQFHNVQN